MFNKFNGKFLMIMLIVVFNIIIINEACIGHGQDCDPTAENKRDCCGNNYYCFNKKCTICIGSGNKCGQNIGVCCSQYCKPGGICS
ncbi:unnamed protein product [Meloidogyne enterolobii]|uniref:Uncharacterized protein n=2 Tax=Meloidogyne enterolobii TaxID=390850 RepID=A0A6V7XDZ8_MELEN|nr:unnamed protein product [Meloidogyne enterolobii]